MYNRNMKKIVKFVYTGTHYPMGVRVNSGDVVEIEEELAKAYEKNRWGNIYKPKGKKKEK
jgi:hypothetical protein|tara:strand:- start:895 stop:1074 length:180 start_codon:yes stop_codon:yes gene_type:complete